MRDQLTTAIEIVGLALIALAVGGLASLWHGVLAAGISLVLVGILEGRK